MRTVVDEHLEVPVATVATATCTVSIPQTTSESYVPPHSINIPIATDLPTGCTIQMSTDNPDGTNKSKPRDGAPAGCCKCHQTIPSLNLNINIPEDTIFAIVQEKIINRQGDHATSNVTTDAGLSVNTETVQQRSGPTPTSGVDTILDMMTPLLADVLDRAQAETRNGVSNSVHVVHTPQQIQADPEDKEVKMVACFDLTGDDDEVPKPEFYEVEVSRRICGVCKERIVSSTTHEAINNVSGDISSVMEFNQSLQTLGNTAIRGSELSLLISDDDTFDSEQITNVSDSQDKTLTNPNEGEQHEVAVTPEVTNEIGKEKDEEDKTQLGRKSPALSLITGSDIDVSHEVTHSPFPTSSVTSNAWSHRTPSEVEIKDVKVFPSIVEDPSLNGSPVGIKPIDVKLFDMDCCIVLEKLSAKEIEKAIRRTPSEICQKREPDQPTNESEEFDTTPNTKCSLVDMDDDEPEGAAKDSDSTSINKIKETPEKQSNEQENPTVTSGEERTKVFKPKAVQDRKKDSINPKKVDYAETTASSDVCNPFHGRRIAQKLHQSNSSDREISESEVSNEEDDDDDGRTVGGYAASAICRRIRKDSEERYRPDLNDDTKSKHSTDEESDKKNLNSRGATNDHSDSESSEDEESNKENKETIGFDVSSTICSSVSEGQTRKYANVENSMKPCESGSSDSDSADSSGSRVSFSETSGSNFTLTNNSSVGASSISGNSSYYERKRRKRRYSERIKAKGYQSVKDRWELESDVSYPRKQKTLIPRRLNRWTKLEEDDEVTSPLPRPLTAVRASGRLRRNPKQTAREGVVSISDNDF